VCNPNQYENDANWDAHYKWTGSQILKQLPDLNVLCTGVGTSGTMTGIGTFLGKGSPSTTRVGYGLPPIFCFVIMTENVWSFHSSW
jgi:cysteine synthase